MGDIHGEFIKLNELINKLNLKQEDTGCGKYPFSPLTALICGDETFVYSN